MSLSYTSSSDDLFEAFFDLSLTGGILFAPVQNSSGEIIDLAYVRLNPAAQHMLALPAHPAETFLARYPPALPTDIFAFYREAYESGETRRGEFNYQHDGLGDYWHLAARRVGRQLLVSFTAASDQPRTAAAQALHQSQAREQEARAEADAERQRLRQAIQQMPANIALLRGPEHTYTLVNPEYERLFPGRAILGHAIREVIPEIAGQGFYELLDQVFQTGEPFYQPEAAAWADYAGTGQLQRRYYRTSFEPIRNAQGEVVEILNFAVDITAQVEARQQVEQLNHELETRVLARTHELEAARAATERERWQWEQLFTSAPAAICIFSGPEWVYEFVNPSYQALFPGRQLLGKRLVEALPEVANQPLLAILHHVYDTGETYEASEVLVPLARTEGGPIEDIYFDLTYQARYNDAGQIDGFITYAYDVTEQVLARRQAETLQAAMLGVAQRQVQQREELYQVFEQAPAAIVLLREPNHRIEYVNPAYQQWFPGEALLGRLLAEAHPDAAASGIVARLDRVYQTGEPYVGEEQPVALTLEPGQPAQTRYFNFVYQPYREAGRIVGVSIFAYDVTTPMLTRRAAVRELEVQRQELQRIFEQAPVAITILRGPELVIELANAAIGRIWGRPASHTVGRPHFEAMPETVGQGFQELLLQVLHTGQPLTITEAPAQLDRGQAGQAEQAYVNFTFQPLADEHGTTTGLIAIGVEVTEQVLARQRVEQLNQGLEARVQARTQEVQAAQAAAERERALLQALFTQAPVAIALFQDEAVRIASANERMAALWGRAPGQVVGRPLVEAVPELRGQGFDEMIRTVLATRVPYIGTEAPANILQDGKMVTRYYNFSCQPIYDAQNEVVGVINVGTEVTEQVETRRQIEQLNQELETRVQERTRQLSEQQELLRQILGQLPASIATLHGPEHHYTFFNELYQTLSAGRTALGRTVAEVFPEVVEQGFTTLLDQVYATGEPFVGTGMPAQLYDARTGQPRQYYVDFIYQPLFDGQQRVRGILAFILDVTDRTLARQQAEQSQRQVHQLNQELAAINEELQVTNEELNDSNLRLTRTNTDLDTFVYTASHDLKAPINNIEGLLSALRDYLPAEPDPAAMVPRLLGMMDGAVARFLQTISHLTEVSRIQHAAHEPVEAIVLADLVNDLRLDLAPLIEAAHAQLQFDFGVQPTIFFSPKNLRSILYNLLSNALKYRDPARALVVQLRAYHTSQQVVLEVEDNGLGLTAPQQARLFSLFQRLHTHVEGTGVGLYMLKKIVENAGGTITVRSQPGVGSTFTVILPRFLAVRQPA